MLSLSLLFLLGDAAFSLSFLWVVLLGILLLCGAVFHPLPLCGAAVSISHVGGAALNFLKCLQPPLFGRKVVLTPPLPPSCPLHPHRPPPPPPHAHPPPPLTPPHCVPPGGSLPVSSSVRRLVSTSPLFLPPVALPPRFRSLPERHCFIMVVAFMLSRDFGTSTNFVLETFVTQFFFCQRETSHCCLWSLSAVPISFSSASTQRIFWEVGVFGCAEAGMCLQDPISQ